MHIIKASWLNISTVQYAKLFIGYFSQFAKTKSNLDYIYPMNDLTRLSLAWLPEPHMLIIACYECLIILPSLTVFYRPGVWTQVLHAMLGRLSDHQNHRGRNGTGTQVCFRYKSWFTVSLLIAVKLTIAFCVVFSDHFLPCSQL